MPELPEIHTITKDLKKYVSNSFIYDIEILEQYVPISNLINNKASLLNKKILDAQRISKNIVLKLEKDTNLLIHLRMTGQLLLRKKETKKDSWTRVVFKLKKKDNKFELRFTDKRKFATIKVVDDKEISRLLSETGPEPISPKLTHLELMQRIKNKNTSLKNAILDQKIVAGLGNVYATDALWIAQIHPETSTKDVNEDMSKELLDAMREILNEGIKNRGISMSDYVDLFGRKGNQQNNFRIYRKEKCPRCNTKVEFKKIGGRGTYYCQNCQYKKPRKAYLL